MNSRYLILALCVVLLVLMTQGCNPWRFALQAHDDYPIEGRILAHKNSVQVPADNVVSLTAPARVAIRTDQITDGEFSTEVTLNRGSSFDLVFRSTPYDDSTTGGTRRLTIHITSDTSIGIMAGTSTVVVSTADTTVANPISIQPSVPFRIVVLQQGLYTDIEVACVRVGRFTLQTPSTQWVSIIPSDGTQVTLVDPRFKSLEDVYYLSTMDILQQTNWRTR